MIILPTYKWNSLHRPIYFGLNYNETYAWAYPSVVNDNGYALFISSPLNLYGTPPCKFIYITSGIYQGFHAVKKITATGDILTATPFISTASGTNVRLLVNLNYEIYTGYPAVNYFTTINPYWKYNGELVVNVAPFLQARFKSPIQPAIPGVDVNMFTHFRIKIVAGKDFKEHLLNYSLNPQTIVDTMTNYIWNSAANLWYVANSSITHDELQLYVGGGTHIHVVQPELHSNMILSKIVADKIENIII